ncbi:cupin domain-containing protein, partial [Levilactobacillus namurensis]|uniref:cupin domain-containing protein n=1 Tax=Levilactobacillus namurensis TaxID=380393 RepID=UPI000465B0FC
MILYQHFGLESKPIFKHFELTNFNYPPHLHRAFEVIIVETGQLHVQIEKKTYHVNQQQFIIIFPNQIHGFNMLPNSRALIILFSPELVGAFSEQYQEQVPQNPVIFGTPTLDFDKLTDLFAIKGFLYTLCSQILAQTTLTPQKTSDKLNIVHDIIGYVNQNYAENCTLKSAATSLGYDYVYL